MRNSSDMVVLLTGFGAFPGARTNPTMAIVAALGGLVPALALGMSLSGVSWLAWLLLTPESDMPIASAGTRPPSAATMAVHVSTSKKPQRGARNALNSRRCRSTAVSIRVASRGPLVGKSGASGTSRWRASHADHMPPR